MAPDTLADKMRVKVPKRPNDPWLRITNMNEPQTTKALQTIFDRQHDLADAQVTFYDDKPITEEHGVAFYAAMRDIMQKELGIEGAEITAIDRFIDPEFQSWWQRTIGQQTFENGGSVGVYNLFRQRIDVQDESTADPAKYLKAQLDRFEVTPQDFITRDLAATPLIQGERKADGYHDLVIPRYVRRNLEGYKEPDYRQLDQLAMQASQFLGDAFAKKTSP